MKMKAAWSILLVAGLLLPGTASAMLEMDYYTWNAFDETVAAFQRLALFVSDSEFKQLATCFMVGGVLFGMMLFMGQAHSGQMRNPLTVLVPVLIGSALFVAAVAPRGTIYVYDPVRNKNQAVGDVPDLVILIAGSLNALEREVIRISDTASANPYGSDAGTIEYSLLLSAVRAPQTDISLERSIARYYKDCGIPAINTNMNGVSMQEVLRTTDDLYTTFAKFAHPAWPTVWYPAGADGGVTGTCKDAWTYLSSSAALGSPNAANAIRDTICTESGFNMADAAQVASCDSLIVTSSQSGYGIAVATSPPYLRNFVMSDGISRLQNDPDFSTAQSQMINRQMMAESFGTTQSMNQWVPKLRGFMLASTLAVTPFVLLFIITPLMFRAMSVLIGLYAWLTLWGICDAAAVQMAHDAASDAFAQIRLYKMGYEAIMNTPDGAVQALAVFGKARLMAMSMATVLSAALLKFGGSAMTAFASSQGADFGQAGEAAGQNTIQPGASANVMREATESVGQYASTASYGFTNVAGSSAMQRMRGAATYREMVGPELSGQMSPGNALDAAGRMDAGELVGGAMGGMAAGADTGSSVAGVSRDSSAANRERSLVTGAMLPDASRAAGFEGGLAQRAAFETRNEAQATGVQREVAKEFGGDGMSDTAIGKKNAMMANEQVAAVRGSGGSVARDETKREANYRQGLAEAETKMKFADGPERAGTAAGLNSMASTEGTESVVGRDGFKGLAAGQVLQQNRAAAAGVTAGSLGGAAQVGSSVGRQDTLSAEANARARRQVSRMLGFGGSDAGQLQFEMASGRNFSAALDGPQKNAAIDNLERTGVINKPVADILRDRPGALQVSGSLDPQGNITSAQFHGDVKAYAGATASIENGINTRDGDTTNMGNLETYGDSLNVAQGLSLRDDSAGRTLQNIMHGDVVGGKFGERENYALAMGYAQRLQAEGYSGSASQTTMDGHAESVGIGASGTDGEGKPRGGGAIGKVLGLIGVNVSANAQHSSQEAKSTQGDFVVTGFAAEMGANLKDSREMVARQLGTDLSSLSGAERARANDMVAAQWQNRNEMSFDNLKGVLSGRTVGREAEGQGESEIADRAKDASAAIVKGLDALKPSEPKTHGEAVQQEINRDMMRGPKW